MEDKELDDIERIQPPKVPKYIIIDEFDEDAGTVTFEKVNAEEYFQKQKEHFESLSGIDEDLLGEPTENKE